MPQNPEGQMPIGRNPVLRFVRFCRRSKDIWEPVVWIFGLSAAIGIADWFILGTYVDSAVDKRIFSQQTLENVSARLRPYALIDAPLNSPSATFQYDDHGAFSEIVDRVDFHEAEPGMSAILTFKMKKYVRLPLVRPLTAGIYVQSFWQTNKFDWAFEIRTAPTAVKDSGTTTFSASQSLPNHCSFFVELLTD